MLAVQDQINRATAAIAAVTIPMFFNIPEDCPLIAAP